MALVLGQISYFWSCLVVDLARTASMLWTSQRLSDAPVSWPLSELIQIQTRQTMRPGKSTPKSAFAENYALRE